MGDQEEALAGLLPQVQQEHLHALAGQRVERAERLVEQQEVRFDRQRTCQPEALALAAGELGDGLLGVLLEAHQLQDPARPRGALGLAQATDAKAQGDVVEGVEPGHQGVVLEHHAALAAGPFECPTVDLHASLVRLLETGEDVQQCRLAAARRAQHHQRLALGQAQAEIAEDGAALAALFE